MEGGLFSHLLIRSNYDDTTTEPELLPSIFPNVLCNGSLGIAVGMSCSLLPHNLNEVCDLLTAIINGNVNTVDEALTILQGPDFPLGGVVVDGYKLKEAYSTGRGSITQRAKYVINKDHSITFSEFPYLVDVETRIIKAIKKNLWIFSAPKGRDYYNRTLFNTAKTNIICIFSPP